MCRVLGLYLNSLAMYTSTSIFKPQVQGSSVTFKQTGKIMIYFDSKGFVQGNVLQVYMVYLSTLKQSQL